MNRELTGKNQTYARTMNNQAVIEMLRKQDCSATFLADNLNLSNAAMSSILRRLKSSGIIRISHALAHCSKGRKQLFYSLNPDFGIFIIVELSNNRYTITLSNLKEESLISIPKKSNTTMRKSSTKSFSRSNRFWGRKSTVTSR